MSSYFEKDNLPTWNDVQDYSDKWDLYKKLIAGIPSDVGVKKLMLGEQWAYVEAESGVGVSMMVRGGAGQSRINRAACEFSLRDLAALSTSWSFVEATAGVAALNAWYAAEPQARAAGMVIDEGENDGFRVYKELVAGKRVAVVGHFPLIERMGDICDLTILERAPQPGDIPDPACEYIIGEQDYLFTTGITWQNKTLPRLLEIAREGGTEVIMVGPSVVPAPLLFDYGVTCLAGSIVLPERAEKVKLAMEQGSHTSIFGAGLQKMRIEKPGWR